MPLGPATVPLINAGASLLGEGINAWSQGNMNKKNRKWNEKMYWIQREQSINDWNMQNAYNAPLAQMQRLKDANLNPHLVYGNGATAEGGTIRGTDTPSWNPKAPQWGNAITQPLMAYYQTAMQQQTIDNMRTQNTVNAEEARLKAAQTIATLLGTDETKQNMAIKSDLRASNLEAAKLMVSKMQTDIESTRQGMELALNEDERRTALNASNIKEALQRISASRIQTAISQGMSQAQIEQMRVQNRKLDVEISNLEKDGLLKDYEKALRDSGIAPGSPWWLKNIDQLLKTIPSPGSLKGKIKGLLDQLGGQHRNRGRRNFVTPFSTY